MTAPRSRGGRAPGLALCRALLSAPLLLAACATPPVPEAEAVPAPYSAAVVARFPAPAVRYDTPAFERGREGFTSNDEVSAWLHRLAVPGTARGGTSATLISLGKSQEGVPIQALHLARAPRGERPLVLLVGQQHGDEPAGSEALLVLANELATGRLSGVLDRIDVILLPRANPDGAVLQRRVTANGIDANRDHLLLRTPEATAMAALTRDYRAVVVVDAHEHTVVGRYLEKFKAVQRHDMLLQYAMTANLPEAIGRASEEWFRQPLLGAMAREGLMTEWYYTNPTAPGDLRISMGGAQPDTGRNVNGLKNTISILLESRGVGIGRLHLTRRVHSHVVALRSILQSAALHADALGKLKRDIDELVAALACRGDAVVLAGQTPGRRDLLFIDPMNGRDRAINVEWNSSLELRTISARPRPCGYWLDAGASDAVARLRALGVVVQRVGSAQTLRGERYRETARQSGQRDDVRGRIDDPESILRVQVALDAAAVPAPEGSYYVGLDQPLANLVLAALEPDTQNSYFANRVIASLPQIARVTQRPAAAGWAVLP